MKIKTIVIFLFSSITLIAQKTEVEKIGNKITEPNNLWNGVSIDVIITISIFITGLIFKYLYDFYKEKNRLKSIKKYFVKLIKSLNEPVKVQCSSYKSLSKNIGDFSKYDFPFEENPRLNIEGFKQVSQYDFYRSVVTKLNKKNINSIFDAFISTVNIIKSIELQKEFAGINYKEFTSRHREYINDFNSSINKLLRTYDSELTSMKNDDILLIEMSRIFGKTNKKESDAKTIIDKIINPLYDLLVTKIDDKRTSIFLEIIIATRKSYSDLSNLKNIYSNLFNNFSNKLDIMSKELINNVNVFENKILK
jgi:hypothetical protein